MFKIEKSAILKCYTLFTILCLVSYNLITHSPPKFSNIFIAISISLNLFFASYYLLFKENVILNGSESIKTLFVACTSEYLLVWEIVNLLGKPQDLTIYYSNYAYLGLVLLHLGLYQLFPKVFEKFIKFNFGFSYGYLMTNCFLQNYIFIQILASLVVSIIMNYYYVITLDYMTVCSSNFIYSAALFEAFSTLLFWIPLKNATIIGSIAGICISLTIFILVITIRFQLEDLENKDDDENLKGEKLLEIV